jgi:hypothetical protein
MSIRMSVRIVLAINIMLLAALLDRSAVAQHRGTQIRQASQFGPDAPSRSAPEWAPTSQLTVGKPGVRRQRVLRRERSAAKAASHRPATTREIQIAQRPWLPSARAAAPVESAVAADEFNAFNRAKPVQPNGSNPAESGPMSAPPDATSPAVSAPVRVEAGAQEGQVPETPDPAGAGVRTVAADAFSGLDHAAAQPVQPRNPAETGSASPPLALSATSALRAAVLGLGPVMVVGFLAWCARRRPVQHPKPLRPATADAADVLRNQNGDAVGPAGAGMRISPEPRAQCEATGAIRAEIDDVIDLAPSEYNVLSWPHVAPADRAALAGSK